MTLDLKQQKSRLQAKKAELEQSIAALTEANPKPVPSLEIHDEPQDTEDLATDFLEMQQEQALMVNQQALLTLVNQALQRLENGTYEQCVQCGRPIPERRLEAIPWANRDVQCEQRLEQQNLSRAELYDEPQTF